MLRKLTVPFLAAVVTIALAGETLGAQTPAAEAAAPPAAQAGPAPATPESAAAFLGDWTLTAEGANGPATFALLVKVEEGKVGAEISSEMQPRQAISDITTSGADLILKYLFDYQGMPVPVVVTLKPAGDKVGAQLDFADGAYQMAGTATKKKP